jgi:hypothetical protein
MLKGLMDDRQLAVRFGAGHEAETTSDPLATTPGPCGCRPSTALMCKHRLVLGLCLSAVTWIAKLDVLLFGFLTND